MQSDYKPILFKTDSDFPEIELYFAHDIHRGSKEHDAKKWDTFKKEILSEPYKFIVFVGDYCENAVVGSKPDIYEQVIPPALQKEWFTEQLFDLKDHVVCIVPGNHEDNRITRVVGLFPVYDCAKEAGIENLYRHNFAISDIAVGSGGHGKDKQVHYAGFVTHRLRDCKMYNGADFVDGIDFAAYGHDHDPKDHPRSKLAYDSKNKIVVQKDIEVINSGSFLTYGGYGVKAGYRPLSNKCYKLVLCGKNKSMKTVGFRV